ncbi:GNAT family N-acetyltransferase [Herbiconiux solani]|uniref:GNAT family N-acetyltransferase n=1 Tax=Herbiconiux solani TaxID=661329 RepID=UPI00082458DB|nr:GNAT family N-acetyltransferase [Herbiconiux solani]
MTLRLQAMDEDALAGFIAASNAGYRQERIDSGDTEAYADERVAEANAQYFPGGRPAEGQLIFEVLDDDTPVGTLWIGPLSDSRPGEWWVFDVEIREEHRGKGFGRGAMLLAEQEAKAHGAEKLGLNVFGHNTIARGLYESLGYLVTAQNMARPL